MAAKVPKAKPKAKPIDHSTIGTIKRKNKSTADALKEAGNIGPVKKKKGTF